MDGGSAGRKATLYTQSKRTQTSTPRVGFQPTTLVLWRAKTVHALDRTATVIGSHWTHTPNFRTYDAKLKFRTTEFARTRKGQNSSPAFENIFRKLKTTATTLRASSACSLPKPHNQNLLLLLHVSLW
jgi:hypothetical protein